MICNKTMKIFTILSLCLYFSSPIMWAEGSESVTPAPSLPSPECSFKTIRTKGMIFVDKTMFIERLLDLGESRYILLTRARRFGKTTFLEMLNHFFSADRYLFNDTYIAKRFPEPWTKYPVIKIDFSFVKNVDGIADIHTYEKELEDTLRDIGAEHGLDPSRSYRIDFLIKDLQAKYRQPVVILVDEYDEIFRKVDMKNADLYERFRSTACTFYKMIRMQRDNIKMVFITGISRLNLVDIGSGLTEVSIHQATFTAEFSSAIGFTLEEIESNFKPHLQRLADHHGVSVPTIIENLTMWYDGYRFSLDDDKTKVFNPVSIICCLEQKKIKDYWADTRYTDFIIKQMKQSKTTVEEYYYYRVPHTDVEDMQNKEFGPEIPTAVALYNHGYLTIKRYNKKSGTVILAYPNLQIEHLVTEKLEYASYQPTYCHGMNISLRENDIESFIEFVNKAAFREYGLSQIEKIKESVATKYILDALVNNRLGAIHSTETMYGPDGQTVGDLDIELRNPKASEYFPKDISLTIEVKVEQSAAKGMLQLFGYAVKEPVTFRRKIKTFSEPGVPAYTYLLAINVRSTKRIHPKIDEWIAIPYRNGKIFADEMVAKIRNDKDASKALEDGWKGTKEKLIREGMNEVNTEILVWSYLTRTSEEITSSNAILERTTHTGTQQPFWNPVGTQMTSSRDHVGTQSGPSIDPDGTQPQAEFGRDGNPLENIIEEKEPSILFEKVVKAITEPPFERRSTPSMDAKERLKYLLHGLGKKERQMFAQVFPDTWKYYEVSTWDLYEVVPKPRTR
ncbi:uncharacterized protein LOC135845372 isoform X1 [Planococcus citri]|uniref:uncharacterized protein LOC135845372 isoform X1 n=1 Tax=Planococcus citri TaxID=170843 RepID=UPI0031F82D5A